MDRREFFKRGGRLTILGSLLAITAISLRRSGNQLNNECGPGGKCNGCGLIASCSLPDAKQYREENSNAEEQNI